MERVLLVGAGGFLGTVLRYLVGGWVGRLRAGCGGLDPPLRCRSTRSWSPFRHPISNAGAGLSHTVRLDGSSPRVAGL